MMKLIGQGTTDSIVDLARMEQIVVEGAKSLNARGKSVLAIIPDHTRTCPLGAMLRNLHKHLAGVASKLDFLVALGTHPPMTESQIDHLLEVEEGRRSEVFPGVKVFNHLYMDPNCLKTVGMLTKAEVERISGGKFSMEVEVSVNKLIFDYDMVVIVGPVFPHEVVGFSGGSKYFFPGISGAPLLNFFHWLGAVITNPKIIGSKYTPVRQVVDAAADMLKIEKYAFCMVVKGHDLAGLYFGEIKEAWSAAADLSDKLHILYVDKPFTSILSRAPLMYDDLWTGGKCMYKMEPVVADGGELIIYAPHITEISVTHGKVIEEIGYHTLEFFLAHWEKYKNYPWGVLAHSTHVRGIGRMVNGVEKCRVQVTLATGIPEAICKKVNLGYRDPKTINIADWEGKEAQGRLYVPKAGEMLYKLKSKPDWQTS